jgi:hypothetical protein
MRQGEAGAGIAVGNRDGIGEVRADRDRLEQEEVEAGDGAGLGDVGRALELREGWDTDEGDEGQPIAGR